ncbi:MAG: ATP-binding protein [Candidatus Daviesbacteria bacterium]|nr:ATP-binding protein [Candidatus Daviesbacteria bacterium]
MTDPKQKQLTFEDAVAPYEVEVDFSFLKINHRYFRSFFVSSYPRYVEPNWLEPLISFEHSMVLSMFIYPTSSAGILDDLKRKIAEMEATIQTDQERGRIVNPTVTVALDDAKALQEQLAKGSERFFQFSLYINVPSDSIEELNNKSQLVQSTLGSISIDSHPLYLQMKEGFESTLPIGQDPLYLAHNMDTTSLATTFPFVSSELTSPDGVIYGINAHNDSLIIFDRFSQENANSVVFATAGAGKSYFVKLESLRSLMLGTEVIIIDPEKEYVDLAKAVGGDYINFSTTSPVKINPFDLPDILNSEEDELGRKILSLTGFLRLVLGDLTANEVAVLDRALNATYKLKGITANVFNKTDPASKIKVESPLMEDLYKVLIGMEDSLAGSLAIRLERFIKGSLAGIFSAQSNINIQNPFTVFSVRELPDQLRPLAMYLILDYIWTKIRREIKKRILVVDEAWYMMKYPDSASFLVEMVKRSRKYYLGVTTISQDVEDFLGQDRGKEIISNSAMQILLKQAPVSIEKIGAVFNLSQGEKRLLTTAGVGQGLFFAGNVHIAMSIVASEEEHILITTNPREILERQEKEKGVS